MYFLWPGCLWLVAALPALPLLYAWLLRRRARSAVRYSNLELVRGAIGRRWRRHVPPALFFVALSILAFAAARPVASLTLPWARSQVLLAMDVSRSMQVSDVKPTRLAAAQEAAKTFLRELPRDIEVGLVTFAATAQVVQPATTDRDSVASAIDAFQMQYGTAIGSAIVVCLSELFPDHGLSVEEMTFGSVHRSRKADEKAKAPPKEFKPVPPGSYGSAAIVLLSDGRRTTGVDTLEAAKMAADRGVRIYVIGLGTVEGNVGAGEGLSIYMQLDEPTLQEVARMTGGQYHHAGTAEDLRIVYRNLGSRMEVQRREIELAPLLALVAVAVVAAGAMLSLLWFNRGG